MTSVSLASFDELYTDITNIIGIIEDMEIQNMQEDPDYLKDESCISYLKGMRLVFGSVKMNYSIGKQIKYEFRKKL